MTGYDQNMCALPQDSHLYFCHILPMHVVTYIDRLDSPSRLFGQPIVTNLQYL